MPPGASPAGSMINVNGDDRTAVAPRFVISGDFVDHLLQQKSCTSPTAREGYGLARRKTESAPVIVENGTFEKLYF
jgi:hypothetical protein